MQVAVVGSRRFKDYAAMMRVLDGLLPRPACIITGGANGADRLAMRYAAERGLRLTVIRPDYRRYGRGAPLVRNREIVACADVVLAFWDGDSRGTANTIRHARACGKEVRVYET